MFYPAEPAALRREVEALLAGVEPAGSAEVIRGIVVPHAGYRYSGRTAGYAYGRLRGRPTTTVVVIAPSHREFFEGVSVYSGEAYATPLGEVVLDVELRDRLLAESDIIIAGEAGHRGEHAVEVQLPFLQTVLPAFRLLPLVIGDQQPGTCLELGRALAATANAPGILMVASSDLSHYHPLISALGLDQVILDDMTRFDPQGLLEHLESGITEACGGGPIAAMMTALLASGTRRFSILHHTTSAETSGDAGSVVGYCSAAAFA
jgi:MEMO1 family protein